MHQLLAPAASRRWSSVFLAGVTGVTAACLGAAVLLMDAVFWRPLPGVPAPRELTLVTWNDTTGASGSIPLSVFPSLASAAGAGQWCPFASGAMSRVTIDGVVRMLPSASWMPSCERVFQVQPRLGRFWTSEADWHRTVVISERLWNESFAGDPLVVGKTLQVDDLALTIVGVAPRSFMGINVEIAPDVFTALTLRTGQVVANGRPVVFRQLIGRGPQRDAHVLGAALRARLHDELSNDSLGVADAQRTAIARLTENVDTSGRGFSYLRTQYAEQVRAVVFIGGLLLLMTLVIVTGVVSVLVRLRTREFAIRESLGATRGRNTRLVLGEMVIPVGIGLVTAAPASIALARTLSLMAWASQTPNSMMPGFRTATFAVFVVMGLLVLTASAVAAAWRLSADAKVTLTTGRQWQVRAGSAWVGALQSAVAVGVLFAASLVVYSVWSLSTTDLGYTREGLVFGRLLPQRSEPVTDPRTHYGALTDRLVAHAGVRAVAFSAAFPNRVRTNVRIEPTQPPTPTTYDVVSENFFDVVGTALIVGRRFSLADVSAPPVAIVSRDFAVQHFGAIDAIGRRLWIGEPGVSHEIVGVVESTRASGRRGSDPVIYQSRHQRPNLNPMIVASVAGPSAAAMNAVASEVDAQGRDYLVGLSTIEAELQRSLAPELTLRAMALAVGALIVVLVLTGLVCQHVIWAMAEWRSTVVRVTLGESRISLVRRIMMRHARIAGAGIVVGIPLALGAGATVARVLPGFGDVPVWLLGVVACGVAGIGLVAAAAPTRALASVMPADVRQLD